MTEITQADRALDRFAENALALRRRAGLSQEEVAARAELHRTEVSNVERRLRMPRLATIIKIAGATGSEPRELLEDLSWDIDPARRWRPAGRPVTEMATAQRGRSVWINGGWVGIER